VSNILVLLKTAQTGGENVRNRPVTSYQQSAMMKTDASSQAHVPLYPYLY